MDTSDIRQEELNPIYQQISRIISLEAAVKLGLEFGGEMIYFPRLDRGAGAILKLRDRQIVEEYTKGQITVKRLARKHGLGQRRIFQIIKHQKAEKTSPDG